MVDEKKKETEQETTSKKSEGATGSENAGAQKKEGDTVAVVEEAKQAALDLKIENTRREGILVEEKRVLDRKESLNALGGGSPGGEKSKPNLSDEEIASRKRIKGIGDATGAQWAKDMDKEDGK